MTVPTPERDARDTARAALTDYDGYLAEGGVASEGSGRLAVALLALVADAERTQATITEVREFLHELTSRDFDRLEPIEQGERSAARAVLAILDTRLGWAPKGTA